MKVSIYSREEIEKLISKGFPEKTAVISFYDPRISRKRIVLRRLYKRLMMTASI